MFRFASPVFLVLLLLIPLIAWHRRRRPVPVLAGSDAASSNVHASPALIISRWLPLLCYLALVLMVLALARPQWGTQRITMNTEGINIVLAMDLSESMAALDFKHEGKIVNRLEAVKIVVRDFITRRSGDRIGMVVFGSQAYTQLPLTRDYGTIAYMLDRLQIGAAGRTTAIGDAIGISLKRLQDIKSGSNIIILLTDGRSNSGELEPLLAADIAKQKEVKIYTIGVGGTGRPPFLTNDPLLGRRYIYQQVDLDEKTLKGIANRTGGQYFRGQDLEGLQKIYETIDGLEKTKVEIDTFAEYRELYFYLLASAFGLLAVWIVMSNTRFITLP